MHDFFLERDYPAITELTRVAALLTPDHQMPDLLRQRLKRMPRPSTRPSKNSSPTGAATIDMAGNVRASEDAPHRAAWRKGYDEQISFRRSQIDRMVQFAESPPVPDGRPYSALRRHPPTVSAPRVTATSAPAKTPPPKPSAFPPQKKTANSEAILRALDGQTRATGKLHTELSTSALRNTPAADRKIFDTLLDALVRSGLITLNTDSGPTPKATSSPSKKLLSPTKAAPSPAPYHPTSPSKIRQPTQQLLPAKKRQAAAPVQNPPKPPKKPNANKQAPPTPPNKNPSKPLSAAGAKPKLQNRQNPPSSSSATASFTT